VNGTCVRASHKASQGGSKRGAAENTRVGGQTGGYKLGRTWGSGRGLSQDTARRRAEIKLLGESEKHTRP